jgi:hypothetical protein
MKKRSNSQRSQKVTIKAKGAQERVTIGIDLEDKTSRYCMLSNEGEILREEQVATTKAGIVETFGSLGRIRIAIEVGTPSPWVSRLLQNLGHETGVANPKQVKLITESSRKTIDGRTNLGPVGANWRELILSCCDRCNIAAKRPKAP